MRYLLMIGFLLSGFSLTFAQENRETSEIVTSELDLANAEDLDQLYLQSFRGSAKIISKAEYEKISADEIAYISVINDERSTYIYGDKAKNGVVLVVMKDNSLSERFSTRKRRNR
jgi:hypothetical protein